MTEFQEQTRRGTEEWHMCDTLNLLCTSLELSPGAAPDLGLDYKLRLSLKLDYYIVVTENGPQQKVSWG